MPVRAADAYGSLTNADLVAAINYACANGANIVNGASAGLQVERDLERDPVGPCSDTRRLRRR